MKMASRGGARAQGTDGGDFSHRETVASHYQVSSTNKKRLKTTIFLHIVLFLFVLGNLFIENASRFDLPLKKFVTFKLPQVELWEYAWLSSSLFIIAAYLGLRKNYITPMKIYAVGTFVTGICPLMCGIIYHSGDMKAFLLESVNAPVKRYFGSPDVLIRSVFIVVGFLVHFMSIMFARKLISAWVPKKGKKKQ